MTDDGTATPLYALTVLKDATNLLAASAANQLAFYGPRVVAADELVSDFDYALGLIWCLEDAGVVSTETKLALDRVGALIDQMAGLDDESLWTPDALHNRPEWEVSRAAAAVAVPLIEAMQLADEA
jgi:hypothetical protein